jgi:hypothetical protein
VLRALLVSPVGCDVGHGVAFTESRPAGVMRWPVFT